MKDRVGKQESQASNLPELAGRSARVSEHRTGNTSGHYDEALNQVFLSVCLYMGSRW